MSRERADFAAAQVRYGNDICAWLTDRFPDLGPHPAAIVEVIHLHWRHGRGHLTVSEHGPQIRAAVSRFNKELL